MGCSSPEIKTEEQIPPPIATPIVEPVIEPEPEPEPQPTKKIKVIWLDPYIDEDEDGEEMKMVLKELKIDLYTKIMDVINYLKITEYDIIRIFINSKIYDEFLKYLKLYLFNIISFPQPAVLTDNEEEANQKNKENKSGDQMYFYFGDKGNKLEKVKNLLKAQQKMKAPETKKRDMFNLNTQLTFEYINSKENLMLPLFFKSLIENAQSENIYQYTQELFKIYCEQSLAIQATVESIEEDVTLGELSKYYAKLYSIESGFYNDINTSLRMNQSKMYIPFIKVLYEGVKLKSLPLAIDTMLYRGAKIGKDEIAKIKDYLKNKIEGLPGSIVFSRPFLSFTKDRDVAISFLISGSSSDNLSKILFVLEKDDSIGYNISTHCDLEHLSFFQSEKEVLFFPFSSFEIKDLKEIAIGSETGYEMRLLYLGKYLKDIENDKDLMLNADKLPDTEFKKDLINCGLIQEDKIQNISAKSLIKNFKKYESEMNKTNNNCKKYESEMNKTNNNCIAGEIIIGRNDINKKIQIINSFENIKNSWEYEGNADDYKHLNEKEFKENIEIKINGNKIEYSYFYKFEVEGTVTIEYSMKKSLTKTNYMFYNCKYLRNLDLSDFNTENVEDMSYMFFGCSSLTYLNLSNFNTAKVTSMFCMFNGCKSLKELDLSDFNTGNVENMSFMFYDCKSLNSLNISNFDTQKVTDMSYMFRGCESLMTLDISNFNTDKVEDMSFMFSNCKSLINLNISNFNTQNVTNMNDIFAYCDSLPNIDLTKINTQKATHKRDMFESCISLKNSEMTKAKTLRVKNKNNLFLSYNPLQDLNDDMDIDKKYNLSKSLKRSSIM